MITNSNAFLWNKKRVFWGKNKKNFNVIMESYAKCCILLGKCIQIMITQCKVNYVVSWGAIGIIVFASTRGFLDRSKSSIARLNPSHQQFDHSPYFFSCFFLLHCHPWTWSMFFTTCFSQENWKHDYKLNNSFLTSCWNEGIPNLRYIFHVFFFFGVICSPQGFFFFFWKGGHYFIFKNKFLCIL